MWKITRLTKSTISGFIGVAAVLCSVSTGNLARAVSEDDPSIHLTGASNARDLGVYHTRDGRSLRQGLIFRSNRLDGLTARDIAKIRSLHIEKIIDLRQIHERLAAPDPEIPGVTEIVDDIIGAAQGELPVAHSANITTAQVATFYKKLYESFVTDAGERIVIHNAIKTIIDSAHDQQPILYHCMAGKDRTGWITAILLLESGVDYPIVYQDFLLSNHYLHARNTSMNGVDRSYLETAFQAVQKQFRDIDRYWSDGLKLTNSDRDQLRSAFVMPR